MSFKGVGTILARGDGSSPEVFTAIAKIVSIGGPEETKDELDDTTLDSTGGYKEFLSGLKDPGNLVLALNYNPAGTGQTALETDYAADTKNNYRLTWPDSPPKIVTVLAEVFSFSRNTEAASLVTADVTLRISGAPVFS